MRGGFSSLFPARLIRVRSTMLGDIGVALHDKVTRDDLQHLGRALRFNPTTLRGLAKQLEDDGPENAKIEDLHSRLLTISTSVKMNHKASIQMTVNEILVTLSNITSSRYGSVLILPQMAIPRRSLESEHNVLEHRASKARLQLRGPLRLDYAVMMSIRTKKIIR
ncbi:hypothetical protein H0H93_001369, partial [Arthromyces matolae]